MLGKAAEKANEKNVTTYTNKTQKDAIRLAKVGSSSSDDDSLTSKSDTHSVQNNNHRHVFHQNKPPFKNCSSKTSVSNHNNNIHNDSDSDDYPCRSPRSCRNRKLHFITFLAGSNELHCVFEPNECPRSCDLPKSRSSCYTGRCSPDPCFCLSERLSNCQTSPAFSCSKSSVEDSLSDWLRCKERNRLKDSTEKLFGSRKCCRKSDTCLVSCASDSCCKTTSKCICLEPELRPPIPCRDPECCTSPKPCCCPPYRKCSPPIPCVQSLRSKLEGSCYRPSCVSSIPCKLPKCDPCCLPPSKKSNCPSACVSCQSCTESRASDPNRVKKYKQFRKDYVKKWGIKISNSDGGEWVYKDADSILPLFRRKNGNITRITLASDNAMCAEAPESCCSKKCDDSPGPFPCCPITNRQRRGSFCRKLDMHDDEKNRERLVTCFIERGCPRTKVKSTFPSKPTACSKCPTSSCPLPGPGPCAKQTTCLKPAVMPKPVPYCTKPPPSCMRQPCCMKPSCQKTKISPCTTKTDEAPQKESTSTSPPKSVCSFA